MNIVISQPRYLPAISYLQRLFNVDIFVIFDNIQRQSRGFENRNKLIYQNKPIWFSIPIISSNREKIQNTLLSQDLSWIEQHMNKINISYSKHFFFDKKVVEKYYSGIDLIIKENAKFSYVIYKTYQNIFDILNLEWKKIIFASDIEDETIKNAIGASKLLEICKKLDAKNYISGKNGREYIQQEFNNSGIEILYNDPIIYKYKQPNQKDFIAHMGFFDYIFSIGKEETSNIIKQPLILDKI